MLKKDIFGFGLDLSSVDRPRGALYIYIPFMTNNVYSNDDPDAWSLIGNLHLAKMEWGPAQVVTDIN